MSESSNPDLLLTSGLSVAGVLGAAGDVAPTLRFIAVAPLAIYLPGHCAAALILGPGLPWSERIMAAFGLNLAITVLVGCGLGAVGQLDAVSWACCLAVVSCLCCLASGLWSDRTRSRDAPEAMPSWPGMLSWVGLIASAVLAIGAIGLDRRWAVARVDAITFSELWVGRAPGQRAVNIALRSDERARATFSVMVSESGSPPRTFSPIALDPGAIWRATVPVGDGADVRLEASAARLSGDQAGAHRHVAVRFRGDDLIQAR